MSRLSQAVRAIFGTATSTPSPPSATPGPRESAGPEGVACEHAFYGTLRLLPGDSGISAHLLQGRVWEPNIVELFAREFQPGRDVIDAGANLGLHSIALAKLAHRGETVYAFEPHPHIFPLLRCNAAAYPQIRCIDKAASETVATFHMPSIVGMENPGGVNISDTVQAGGFTVHAMPIDALGLANVGLMKIDVEGHEIECVRGAAETIRRSRPVLFVEICGGHDIATAPPDVRAEIQSRVRQICGLGYEAVHIAAHDYLFRPV